VHGRLAELGRVRVEGEVSQRKRASAGHVYFDLEDGGARLACKIWQSVVPRALRFELAEGARVVAWGKLDVYAPQGSYSLIVERVELAGLGARLAELEQRKAELKARGWFDRKRPLPAFPRVIGLVTSRDGAALRDFLRTRSLRWPGYPVRLVHTPVQGPGAAASIADALRALDASGVEVIALVRGGGSLEDLWCFNELAVAEAVFGARVPVVTGIGHETDTTLADLVADRRAHTPTDAAQSVIPDRAELRARIERLGGYLGEAFGRHLQARLERLERLAARPVLRGAGWILDQRALALAAARARLDHALRGELERRAATLARAHAGLARRAPGSELARRAQLLATAHLRLAGAAGRALERRVQRLALGARGLEAVSPLAVLARGYSLTRREGTGETLTDAALLAPGERVETRLARGSFRARVESVRPADEDA
jgi:exodeoxyribonuclease VII large subunit